ncbi:immunity 49 family protein [Streptomyces cupreus]|uniref:Immunity 49 family protein n=1 Tax=Streptomyces cupreus TaxID=2759956 RepID=A0A7X1MD10_9ACTN|nr:immunity 49 family protein [Streptomyces cupreus]MBC2906999.1 immunity 49 family protein [Streptomyces cupreus]
MTVQIARHGLSAGPEAEQFAERLGEHLAWEIGGLEESTAVIDSTFGTAVMMLRARCVIDPRAAAVETWEAAVNAMQVGSALFAVTAVREGTIECRIDHKVRTLPTVGPLSTADAGNWLTAFWLAVICREPQRMNQLCEIPLERLRSPEGQYDEYIYHWVDTLQTYWLRRPGLVEKLTTTLRMSHPDVARIAPRDLLDGVLYPPIHLFSRLIANDWEGFASGMVEALKLHRAYWTLNEERAANIDGSIALGPLAMACWAYDGQVALGVESDYLPKHLVEHSWLGEFPT